MHPSHILASQDKNTGADVALSMPAETPYRAVVWQVRRLSAYCALVTSALILGIGLLSSFYWFTWPRAGVVYSIEAGNMTFMWLGDSMQVSTRTTLIIRDGPPFIEGPRSTFNFIWPSTNINPKHESIGSLFRCGHHSWLAWLLRRYFGRESAGFRS